MTDATTPAPEAQPTATPPVAPAPQAVPAPPAPTPATEAAPPPSTEKPAEKPADDTILTAPVKATEVAKTEPEKPAQKGAPATFEVKKDLQGNVVAIEGLKLPEANRVITKEQIEKLAAYARDNKLSPEQAQMLLDRSNAVLFDHEKANEVMLAERRASWLKQTMEDREIGGVEFDANAEIARRVIDRYASPALKKALSETGLGNHTELVRFVVRIGRELSEDKLVTGSVGKPVQQRSHAEVLYGS